MASLATRRACRPIPIAATIFGLVVMLAVLSNGSYKRGQQAPRDGMLDAAHRDAATPTPSEQQGPPADKRRNTVAMAILTHAETVKRRVRSLMRSWGSYANVRLIVTDTAGNHSEVLRTEFPQLRELPEYTGRKTLGSKALRMLQLMCADASFTGREAHADHRESMDAPPGFAAPTSATTGEVEPAKWFVLVDDDTFVVVPNLLSFVAPLDPTLHFYGGYVLDHLEEGPFVGGGGGIILSRHTLAAVCRRERKHESRCTPEGTLEEAGDTAIAECIVKELGVKPTHIEGVLPFNLADHLQWKASTSPCKNEWWYPSHHLPCEPPRRLISFHYAKPSELPLLTYALIKHERDPANAAWTPPKLTTTFRGPSKAQIERQRQLRRDLELDRKAREVGHALARPAV